MPTSPIADVRAVPLAALHPAPWNPRTIKDERFQNLCASIQADPEFLWRRPVLAQADGTIYAGNMRYCAAQHLGLDSIPAIVEDITDQLARERAMRDNAQWGEWEEDELAKLLDELKVSGSDLDLLGFEERELQSLLNLIDQQGGLTDPDAIPEPPEEPVTKRGDLWLLGEHRVLCGDSTDPHDVKIVMNGEEAACLWTDPPYGVSYVGGTERKLTIKNDDRDGLEGLLGGAFAAIDPQLVPGAAIYIAHPAGPNALVFVARFIAQGWTLRQGLVWKKDRIVVGHSDYHYGHEPILYGLKPGYAGRRGRGAAGWYGGNACSSVFEIASPVRNADHPTAKPVALVAAMITNSSRTGEVVFDGFLGSGSTLIACEQTGRRCFGIELDPAYVDVVVKRWEQFSGKAAVLAECEAAP